MDKTIINHVIPFVRALRAYHRHEVVGLESIPKEGRVLLVVTHSLATYDIAMLFGAIEEKLGRIVRPLVDRLFFRIPYVGKFAEMVGGRQGSPEAAVDLLNQNEIVAVAPGGMREALRPSRERYQIRWEKRYGFARIAMETQAPVILAACPKADDIYDLYESDLTRWFYDSFRIPVFFARGLGLTPLPRAVKIMHFLSEPIIPPALTGTESHKRKQVKEFQALLVERMEELIGRAVAYREDKTKEE